MKKSCKFLAIVACSAAALGLTDSALGKGPRSLKSASAKINRGVQASQFSAAAAQGGGMKVKRNLVRNKNLGPINPVQSNFGQVTKFRPKLPANPVTLPATPKFPVNPNRPLKPLLPAKPSLPVIPNPVKPLLPVNPNLPIKPIGPPTAPVIPRFPVNPILPPKGPIVPKIPGLPIIPPNFPIDPPVPPMDPPPQDPPQQDPPQQDPPAEPPCDGPEYCPPWHPPYCPPVYLPGFGGGCYIPQPVVHETVIVEQGGFGTAAVATTPGGITEVELQRVKVGSTLSLPAKELGEASGQVLLQIGEIAMPCTVVRWQADAAMATLPSFGLARPQAAVLHIARADGSLAMSHEVLLIPADPAPSAK